MKEKKNEDENEKRKKNGKKYKIQDKQELYDKKI